MFALGGCLQQPEPADGKTEPNFESNMSPPPFAPPPTLGTLETLLPLCQAWMVHAKVVDQGPGPSDPEVPNDDWYMDIALEFKDQRTLVGNQGGICLDQISMWLVIPTTYLEYRGEYCLGPPITTDGQGPQCTEWRTGGTAEYDDLPFPRARIGMSQYHGGGGVPMPVRGKRIVQTARLWRTGVEGASKTHSYTGLVEARYASFPPSNVCFFAGRSAWGHDLTFGPMGEPVTVGPETQFCGTYPGCQRELNYCARCPQ